jgi:hypothetical protein
MSAGLGVRAALLSLGLFGCGESVDADWIAARLAEAHERDTAARASHAASDERTSWTLEVVAPDGTSRIVSYATLAEMARTEVTTIEPDEPTLPMVRYSGVRVQDLVRGVGEHASDVTVLASDGFRGTVEMDDVRLFPIILALDANGTPLERDHGGPIYSVFPFSSHPELANRYTSSTFVYYVTHLLVGTAPPSLRVGTRAIADSDLATLTRVSIEVEVGYRSGWPSEPVVIGGVRVRDVLAMAGATLGAGDRVRVLSRARITRSGDRPTVLTAEDVLHEDVILALSYGETAEPIPSRLGGPIALAFPPAVEAHGTEHDWLTFVDELVVESSER